MRGMWLGGKAASGLPPSATPDEPFAILMDHGMGGAAVTFVAAEDGTGSMYISSGGGRIGMGFYPGPTAAALAFHGASISYASRFPKASSFPLPPNGHVTFHIVARSGVRSATYDDRLSFEDPFVGPLREAGEHLVTNMRLLDQQRQREGIIPVKMIAHIFADGGVCLFVEPNPDGTWLTVRQLARVLEIAEPGGNSLSISAEPGDAALQAPALEVANASRCPRDTTPVLSVFRAGTTSLHFAAEKARLDIVREQVARGADLEARDDLQYTPLILASFRGHGPIAQALVAAGASVKAADRHGNTPLHFAAQSGDLPLAQLLLARGADGNARGQNGHTPLKIARLCKQAETARLLEAQGGRE